MDRRLCFGLQPRPIDCQRVGGRAVLAKPFGRSGNDELSVEDRSNPFPRNGLEVRDFALRQAFGLRLADDGLPQWMLACPFHRRRQSKDILPLDSRDRNHVGDFGFADRQGAGLVKEHEIHLGRALQLGCLLHENPKLGAAAYGHKERGRGREAKGAWARDDDDGDEHERRAGDRPACNEPQGGARKRDEQDRRHEPGAYTVYESLDRRLARLRLLDELRNLRKEGVRAHTCCFHGKGAVGVHCAADDCVPRDLRDGDAFAGDVCLVHLRATLEDPSIGGDPLAGADHEAFPQCKGLDGDVLLDSSNEFSGRARLQRNERAHRRCGAAFHGVLKGVAEEDEPDDEHRRVEVGLVPEPVRQERDHGRKPVRGGRTEGDQGVHVCSARLNRVPESGVEARSGQELDRRRKSP
jgi:hypothetical protein